MPGVGERELDDKQSYSDESLTAEEQIELDQLREAREVKRLQRQRLDPHRPRQQQSPRRRAGFSFVECLQVAGGEPWVSLQVTRAVRGRQYLHCAFIGGIL